MLELVVSFPAWHFGGVKLDKFMVHCESRRNHLKNGFRRLLKGHSHGCWHRASMVLGWGLWQSHPFRLAVAELRLAAFTHGSTVSQWRMCRGLQPGKPALTAEGTVPLIQIALYGQQRPLNKIIKWNPQITQHLCKMVQTLWHSRMAEWMGRILFF